MTLALFIVSNREAILADWVAFARTKMPAANDMSELALRDDAAEILNAIAKEMTLPQGEAQRLKRSQGLQEPDPALPETPSRAHAVQRARSGFEVNQMVSEFRALRATVLRRWGMAQKAYGASDLEDVMRFNEAIDQALAESLKHFIAEVDRARNLFLGVLGHDLRSPLSTIMSVAQLQVRTDPSNADRAEMILRSARQMKALIDDVVSYTRKRLGVGMAVTLAPIDLALLTRHTLDELRAAHQARQLVLETTGDATGFWDKGRMHQLLTNLVGNALKYGDRDVPITVVVDGSGDDEVELHIHNAGPAIPADQLADIFEPMVRAHTGVEPVEDAGADMGLGLYIVREIVNAHGGRVTVKSVHPGGTTFTVCLPRQPEAESSASATG